MSYVLRWFALAVLLRRLHGTGMDLGHKLGIIGNSPRRDDGNLAKIGRKEGCKDCFDFRNTS